MLVKAGGNRLSSHALRYNRLDGSCSKLLPYVDRAYDCIELTNSACASISMWSSQKCSGMKKPRAVSKLKRHCSIKIPDRAGLCLVSIWCLSTVALRLQVQ